MTTKSKLERLSWKDYTEQVVLVLESQPLLIEGVPLEWNRAARIQHAVLGMATEVPELLAALKARDNINAIEELGDILWYAALAYHLLPANSVDMTMVNRLGGQTIKARSPSIERHQWLLDNLTLHGYELANLAKSGFFYKEWTRADYENGLGHHAAVMGNLACVVSHSIELVAFLLGYMSSRDQLGVEYLITYDDGSCTVDLGKVCALNASKLEKRYPAGHFESLKAMSRNLEAEREALEQ